MRFDEISAHAATETVLSAVKYRMRKKGVVSEDDDAHGKVASVDSVDRAWTRVKDVFFMASMGRYLWALMQSRRTCKWLEVAQEAHDTQQVGEVQAPSGPVMKTTQDRSGLVNKEVPEGNGTAEAVTRKDLHAS